MFIPPTLAHKLIAPMDYSSLRVRLEVPFKYKPYIHYDGYILIFDAGYYVVKLNMIGSAHPPIGIR